MSENAGRGQKMPFLDGHCLEKAGDIHAPGQFAHFGGNHFLGFGQGVIYRGQHQVLKHIDIFRIDDLTVDGDGNDWTAALTRDEGRKSGVP